MILLYTNSTSVQKYWQNILNNQYLHIHLNNFTTLIEYIKSQESILLMCDENSVEDITHFLKELQNYNNVKTILFHNKPDINHALNLLEYGIKGYENTYIAKINLLKMLVAVDQGNRWYFKALTHFILNSYTQEKKENPLLLSLTTTQQQIAKLILQGLTNKEIAIQQNITLSTVKNHIAHIFEKIDVHDRISLIVKLQS